MFSRDIMRCYCTKIDVTISGGSIDTLAYYSTDCYEFDKNFFPVIKKKIHRSI